MKRTRLKAKSPKKTAWAKAYAELKKIFQPQSCARCGRWGTPWMHSGGNLDPHHIATRGEFWRMMLIVPLCRECHDWVHANPNLAREDSWLINPRSKQWRDEQSQKENSK